jgi:hypothetical protein
MDLTSANASFGRKLADSGPHMVRILVVDWEMPAADRAWETGHDPRGRRNEEIFLKLSTWWR